MADEDWPVYATCRHGVRVTIVTPEHLRPSYAETLGLSPTETFEADIEWHGAVFADPEYRLRKAEAIVRACPDCRTLVLPEIREKAVA